MKDDSRARPVAIVLWATVVVTISVLLTLVHAGVSQPYLSLDTLARFEERAPFQHRLLVPLIVAIGQVLTRWSTPTIYWVVEACAWAALIVSATAIIGALHRPLSWWTTRAAALTVVLPVSAELIWPSRFRVFAGLVPLGDINAVTRPLSRIVALPNLYYPWDVPSAAFLLLLIAGALRLRSAPTAGRIIAYLVVAFIASLNRETTVLLVPLTVWAVWRHWPAKRVAVFAMAQVVAWAALMAALAWSMQAPANAKATLPGGAYEWYLWTNLRTLTYPLYVLTTVVPMGAGAWLPALIYWRDVPEAGRAIALLYVVPAVVVAITFGVLHETRIFTEASAALWVVAFFAVHARATGTRSPGCQRT
jgi:hypothetical protein